jgi:hypothetical protein
MTADHDDEDDELTSSLAGLPKERRSGPELERQTVQALRARGLLRSHPTKLWLRAGSVAAAVVIFAAGWALGSRSTQTVSDDPRYMLFLYSGQTDAAAEDASVAEYRDWARNLRSTGHWISGERLDDTPAAVLGADTRQPPGGGLRGYFVFDAADDRSAIEIAKQHPHLRRGGIVILHRIRPT